MHGQQMPTPLPQPQGVLTAIAFITSAGPLVPMHESIRTTPLTGRPACLSWCASSKAKTPPLE